MSSIIQSHLKRFRRANILSDIQHGIWFVYSTLLLLSMVMIIGEYVFYFSSTTRYVLWYTLSIILNSGLLLLIYFFLMLIFNRINRYRWTTISGHIGRLGFQRHDAVVNALQLERTSGTSSSPDLSHTYIESIDNRLSSINATSLFYKIQIPRWKHRTLALLIFSTLFIGLTWNSSQHALYRLLNPGVNFPAPTPFSLVSKTGDIHLLGGDPASIIVEAHGAEPDSVFLELQSASNSQFNVYSTARDINGQYVFTLSEIFQDYAYTAFVPSSHFWQAWDRVVSPEGFILVTDRPVFEEFRITVISPDYSKLEPKVLSGNQANIQGLMGSTVSVSFKSSQKIASGYILLNNEQYSLDISGQYGSIAFPLNEDGSFTLHYADERGITNRDPISYHLQVLPDVTPNLTVYSPEKSFDISGDQVIPIHVDIEDDFGFTNLQVGYEIRRPSYLELEPYISIFSIQIRDPYLLSQEIESFWDCSDLGLMPEDEIHFHFELYDNDIISGPKKFVSATHVAHVPSLSDLYESLEEQEFEIIEESHVNLEELQSLQEQIETAKLDVIKSSELNWEQQKEIENILNQTQKEMKHLKDLSEKLNALSEFGEKHGLLNRDLLKKFQDLQELVNDLLSEDLMKNLEDVQQALDDMDMDDLNQALDNLAENMDHMEDTIDRYLDIFKRIQAEQKMDEVVNRLSQLEHQQDKLDEKIHETDSDTDPSAFARLEQEEKWNLDELESIQNVMEEASSAMEDIHAETAEALENLESSSLMERTEADLNETLDNLEAQNPSSAMQSSQMALQDIQSLSQQAQMIQQQFQQMSGMEMAKEFQSALRDVLSISKAQESLATATDNTPRNSPRMGDMAMEQQQLKDQVSHVMSQLMELSRETFAVTPELGQMMGRAFASMEQATQSLSQRNSGDAEEFQSATMEALNQAAKSLHSTAQQMQSGDASASGFEQFMQQMQQMAGKQKGINQQGMQLALGQMAASLQQSLMQRMMAEQQQVRKSLQQLMNEMSGSSGGQKGMGDLSGIAKDMDDVLNDLQRRRFTRKTQERQQRILSRMLDSQKSLMQRGQKEERTSTTASQLIPYSGPGGLPADMGQRRSLTIEALNQALKAGYSSEYQDMIRRYFNTLTDNEISSGSADE